jgi:sulfate transport system substrate-binding protein
VITPDPKTSGGARWNYLAAWGFALKRVLGDPRRAQDPAAAGVLKAAEPRARDFVAELYRHVPVLDQGARGATETFARKGIGDVLLAWENEACQLLREQGTGAFEIVVPSLSILAEPPVALVDKLARKHGTQEIAQAYLEYLYTPAGQALAARHFLRPQSAEGVAPEDLARFPKLELFTVEQVFGDWASAQKKHFEDGGVFDVIRARTRGAGCTSGGRSR